MADHLIAVVGAGAAGLSAALELRDRGAKVILLEASAQAGGKLATIREQGYLIERAALGVLDRRGDFAPLCARLGIAPLPAARSARARFVERAGKVYRLDSPLALSSSRLLSMGEQLSMAAEPLRSRKPAPSADESVASLFRRRLGKSGSFIAELLQTGIYAGDAEQLEAASCFPELVRLERDHGGFVKGALATSWNARSKKRPASRPRLSSFAEGMAALPQAMTRALGDSLRLRASVKSIRPRAEGGFVLSIEGANAASSELHCASLILALPAPQLAALTAPFDPALAAPLASMTAVPIAQVHLGVREADLKSPLKPHLGFGLLAPERPVIGTLFPSALWPDRAPAGAVLVSAMIGGAHFPAAAALPDGALVELVRNQLQQTIGLDRSAVPLHQKIVRWPQAVPQYLCGHAAKVAAIDERCAAWSGLVLTGSWLRGVSVLDCLRDGRRAAGIVHPRR